MTPSTKSSFFLKTTLVLGICTKNTQSQYNNLWITISIVPCEITTLRAIESDEMTALTSTPFLQSNYFRK